VCRYSSVSAVYYTSQTDKRGEETSFTAAMVSYWHLILITSIVGFIAVCTQPSVALPANVLGTKCFFGRYRSRLFDKHNEKL